MCDSNAEDHGVTTRAAASGASLANRPATAPPAAGRAREARQVGRGELVALRQEEESDDTANCLPAHMDGRMHLDNGALVVGHGPTIGGGQRAAQVLADGVEAAAVVQAGPGVRHERDGHHRRVKHVQRPACGTSSKPMRRLRCSCGMLHHVKTRPSSPLVCHEVRVPPSRVLCQPAEGGSSMASGVATSRSGAASRFACAAAHRAPVGKRCPRCFAGCLLPFTQVHDLLLT